MGLTVLGPDRTLQSHQRGETKMAKLGARLMRNKYQNATIALVAFALGLILVFQNCGAPVATSDSNSNLAVNTRGNDVIQLSTSIKTLSDQDLSCKVDTDCEALPLGAKACGGPADYIIVSRLNSEFARLTSLSEELRVASIALNQQTGLASTCDFIEPPAVQCVSSRCQ